MAYNNYYGGANFAPYNPSVTYPMANIQTQQQPQVSQNSGNILTVFINSEDEVGPYPVQAGTTVLLLCFPAKKFWLKSTSTNGVPEALREFPFEETTVAQPSTNQNGVTRDEFNALSEKIDKLISDLGGNNNG